MNREKYTETREARVTHDKDPENPKIQETKDADRNDTPLHSHAHIEMTFTSGSETVHVVIDSNSAETALAPEAQMLQEHLHTQVHRETEPPVIDNTPPANILREDSFFIIETIANSNNTYDI